MLYKSAIMAFIGMNDWYGWNEKVNFCIFEWADAPSFTYGFQRREFVRVLIAARLNLPHFARNRSHSHFYHEDFICQFSLLQPAQPPTPNPTIQPYHPAPWRVAAGSQAVHHEAADELHEMYSRHVKNGWSGGGGGGKVNLAWQGFGCCWARTDVSGIYVYALRVTLRRAAWEEAGVWPVHC